MNDEIAETLGLSPAGARIVRALFQYNDEAGRSRAERRRWLLARVRSCDALRVLARLESAGLLSADYRLTWVGLTVAVNLRPLGSQRSDPLAA